VIVWRVRGKIIRSVLCSAMHTRMNRPNSSLDWVLSHWAHSLCLDHFRVCMYMCACILCLLPSLLYVLGGWWRWALVSPDGVVPSGMVDVCFPCTIKSRSSLLAPAHPGGPGKRAVKQLCVCVICFSKLQHGEMGLVGLKPDP